MKPFDEFEKWFNEKIKDHSFNKTILTELYMTFFSSLKPVENPTLLVFGGASIEKRRKARDEYAADTSNSYAHDLDKLITILSSKKQSNDSDIPKKIVQDIAQALIQFSIREKVNIIYDDPCATELAFLTFHGAKRKGYLLYIVAYLNDKHEKNNQFIELQRKFSTLWPFYLTFFNKICLYNANDNLIFSVEDTRIPSSVEELCGPSVDYEEFFNTHYNELIACQEFPCITKLMPLKTAVIIGVDNTIGSALAFALASYDKIRIIVTSSKEESLTQFKTQDPDKISTIHAAVTDENLAQKILKKMNSLYIDYLIYTPELLPLEHLTDLSNSSFTENLKTFLPLALTNKLLPFIASEGRILDIDTQTHKDKKGSYSIYKSARDEWIKLLKKAHNVHVAQLVMKANSLIELKSVDQQYKSNDFKEMTRFLSWLLLESSEEIFISEKWNQSDLNYEPWLKEILARWIQKTVNANVSNFRESFFAPPSNQKQLPILKSTDQPNTSLFSSMNTGL